MTSLPPEVEKVYGKVLKDAARLANQNLRQTFLERENANKASQFISHKLAALSLGWNPLRASTRGKTGLGFTLSGMDAYRLRDDQDLLNKIACDAVQQAILKNNAAFFTVFLQDVLITPQEESYFHPPKYDPRGRGSKFRNIYGRFTSGPKYQ